MVVSYLVPAKTVRKESVLLVVVNCFKRYGISVSVVEIPFCVIPIPTHWMNGDWQVTARITHWPLHVLRQDENIRTLIFLFFEY